MKRKILYKRRDNRERVPVSLPKGADGGAEAAAKDEPGCEADGTVFPLEVEALELFVLGMGARSSRM